MATYLLGTDRQQSVLGRLPGAVQAYPPYGALPPATVPGLGFCGQHRDPLSGNYPLGNGHRFYSPTLMRFLSPDSLSPFDRGGINAYAYCLDDPVNHIDPTGKYLSQILSAVSGISSAVTAFGATVRAARNVINRLERPQLGELLAQPSIQSRIGNTSFVYTGLMGVAGTVSSGVEQGWIGNVLSSDGRRLGLGNAVGNIVGGGFSNFEAAVDVWQRVGRPGVSVGRVAWETAYEVSGARLLVEAGSYVWGGVTNLGARISSTYRAAADTWRGWSFRPTAPPSSGDSNAASRVEVEMESVRSR